MRFPCTRYEGRTEIDPFANHNNHCYFNHCVILLQLQYMKETCGPANPSIGATVYISWTPVLIVDVAWNYGRIISNHLSLSLTCLHFHLILLQRSSLWAVRAFLSSAMTLRQTRTRSRMTLRRSSINLKSINIPLSLVSFFCWCFIFLTVISSVETFFERNCSFDVIWSKPLLSPFFVLEFKKVTICVLCFRRWKM